MTTETPNRPNRRASRRLPPGNLIKVQCRKSYMGLGPDIAFQLLDLSQTGVRLLVKTPVEKGREVEVLLTGACCAPLIKRVARVVWAVPVEGQRYAVGLHFA